MGSDSPHESSPGGEKEGAPAPLGVPMVDELLADSFLRRRFCHFYETLATASGRLSPALQVDPSSIAASGHDGQGGKKVMSIWGFTQRQGDVAFCFAVPLSPQGPGHFNKMSGPCSADLASKPGGSFWGGLSLGNPL